MFNICETPRKRTQSLILLTEKLPCMEEVHKDAAEASTEETQTKQTLQL